MPAVCRAGSSGESDQDLVPEQESQAEEEPRREGGAGQDAGRSGPLQSPDCPGRRGGGDDGNVLRVSPLFVPIEKMRLKMKLLICHQ